MKIGFKQIILTTVFAGLATPVAMAQSAENPFLRGRYVAVTERSQGDFDPEPLRAGAFEVWSSLGLSADYNSNIFAQPKSADNDTADTILRVNPQIEARSSWSSHALNAGLGVDYADYIRYDTETITTYNAFVDGRLDVLRSFQLLGQVTADHGSEQRYEPGSAGAVNPIEYDRFGANGGALFQRDRIQISGTVGVIGEDYDTVSNFRDSTDTYLSARGSYAISPDVAVFVQGRTGDLDYESSDRDGTRSTVQVGASFELQAPFRGEIAIGSFKDEKDSPAYEDTDGLSVDGRLFWFPTQLTTVTFRANRGAYDSGIVQVATATNTIFGIRVDHELTRNVLLFGDIAQGEYEFEGLNRTDEFTDFMAGAGYKLNKHARLEFGYRLHSQDSTAAGRDIEQHVLSAGLRIYP
jgi:hypothetical protein